MKIILKHKKPNTLDQTFYIDEGSTITENYNETLDSANIRLSHITSKLNIEPFDKVILRDEEERLPDRYMCIDTYTETMESLDPVIYSYEISLFSETKELEGILLPNLAITQLKNGTHRTIWYYLNTYFSLYAPKVRFSGQTTLQPKYSFNPNVQNKFNVECPEMQWNNPTLREVFTDLMMVVDCIPVLRNNVIDYINLTELKDPIDTTKVNYIQSSQSSEDYVSDLKMDMLNVMQTSTDGIKQTVSRMEYQTFKASADGYVITSDNIIIKTQYPILNIKHLWMIFQNGGLGNGPTTDTQKSTLMFSVDLCNLQTINGLTRKLVYEKTEYNALPIRRYNPSNFNEVNQNISVYFERESNIISGFSNLSKNTWIFNDKQSTLNNLKQLIADYCYSLNGEEGHSNYTDTDAWFSTFFIIEYETTADAVFKAGKDIAPTHERTVTDNQTNAYVDAYNQGFMEYQKVNRLGNHQLYINARYEEDYNNLIKIGDYYNDNIIYQTQYQIYKNHIEVNAVATKNYILKDYFTGVKARVRSWKIADASQSLTRHDLEKYYLEFSDRRKYEYFTYDWNIPNYFLSPLKPTTTIQPLKYCFIRTFDSYGIVQPSEANGYYALDLLGRIIGNSIVFTFGFDDNFTAGKKVSVELDTSNVQVSKFTGDNHFYSFKLINITSEYGGVPLEDTRYVDNNGEFVLMDYHLPIANNLLNFDVPNDIVNSNASGDDYQKTWMLRVCKLPVINYSSFTGMVQFISSPNIYKDNREVIKRSIQYEICSDTHDIVFTKKFLQLQECIRELTASESVPTPYTYSTTIHPSDFVKIGGSRTVDVTIYPPYDGSSEDGTGRYSFKAYNYYDVSLYGKTLDSYSITSGVDGHTNTISFDNSYQDAIHGNCGRFYGTIYTRSNESETAQITFLEHDAETPYWIISKYVSPSGIAGLRVENISATGFTPGPSDTFTVTYNISTGTFLIQIITYTQPASDLTITISYDVIGASIINNNIKIYRDDKDNFNWRNPTLGSAELLSSSSLSITSLGRLTASVAITNPGTASNCCYYITANDNILVGVKGMSTFYLNLLLSRDYNVYDANGEVVDSI